MSLEQLESKRARLLKDPDYAAETEHLDAIQQVIRKEIAAISRANNQIEAEDLSLRSESWDEHLELKGGAGQADSAIVQQELMRLHDLKQIQDHRLRDLYRMQYSPYFGRLDFRFAGESTAERFYIGIKPLMDQRTFYNYILDWRAPLSSLYYEAEQGPASYLSPAGEIKGELTKKKQIVISAGTLRMLYDADKALYDENLRGLLDHHAAPKMRDIVATIQAEQNRLIRLDPDLSFLVLGVAGSGKTSVALHRLAYLLYRQPDLTAEGTLIISPNEAFSDYIAELLPALADDELKAQSFADFAREIIAETDSRFAKFQFDEAPRAKREAAAEPSLLTQVEAFVQRFEKGNWEALDLQLPSLTISAEELDQLRQRVNKEPHFSQARLVAEELQRRYREELPGDEHELIFRQIRDVYQETDLEVIYEQFLAATELPPVLKARGERLDRVDLGLMALLAQLLYEPYRRAEIRQMVVDECQDLSLLEHWLLKSAVACPVNLYGDLRQAVRFTLPAQYLEQMLALYHIRPEQLYALNRAYRSSYEITMYSRDFLQDPSIEAFERHGQPVVEQSFRSPEEQALQLVQAIQSIFEAGQRSVAILGSKEDVRALEALAKRLEGPINELNSRLSRAEREEAPYRLDLLTADHAKGLEFDAVLIANRQNFDEQSRLGRTRLYVAMTRALHSLYVFSGPAGVGKESSERS